MKKTFRLGLISTMILILLAGYRSKVFHVEKMSTEYTSNDTTRCTIKIAYTGSKPCKVIYGGQDFDFVIYDNCHNELINSNNPKYGYTGAIMQNSMDKGQSMSISFSIPGRLAPGIYVFYIKSNMGYTVFNTIYERAAVKHWLHLFPNYFDLDIEDYYTVFVQ